VYLFVDFNITTFWTRDKRIANFMKWFKTNISGCSKIVLPVVSKANIIEISTVFGVVTRTHQGMR